MNKKIKNKKIGKLKNKGFTLLTAIVVTAMLLLVSFVVADIALKQLVLAYTGEESQYAFYNAESGMECAEYWDIKADPNLSAFATSTAGTITCNGQTISTNSQSVPTIPSQPSAIGVVTPSIFYVNYTHGCAIVNVVKNSDGTTVIESRGYNTCDITSSRRYERGIRLIH